MSKPRRAKPRRRFAVRVSPIHGKGVFALRRIRKGERILEYKGERISHAEADRRHTVYDDSDNTHTMLFIVDERVVIDATRNGNSARWINHSCSPNCESDVVDGRVVIDAIRNIRPGEELAYDYRLQLDEPHTRAAKAEYPCRCGSPRCRETMLGSKR